MNNDTLINQARRLYANLYIEQYASKFANKIKSDRLEHLVISAYCRYQRRLNRCVLCYQHRTDDCFREFLDNIPQFCPRATYRTHDDEGQIESD